MKEKHIFLLSASLGFLDCCVRSGKSYTWRLLSWVRVKETTRKCLEKTLGLIRFSWIFLQRDFAKRFRNFLFSQTSFLLSLSSHCFDDIKIVWNEKQSFPESMGDSGLQEDTALISETSIDRMISSLSTALCWIPFPEVLYFNQFFSS